MKKRARYAVGYGRPPRHTRFKKGQSGNPAGRPKKEKVMTNGLSIVEVHCDDACVGAVQRALAGIRGVRDVRSRPMVNAKMQNGHVRAETSGNSLDMLVSHLAKNKRIKSVTPADLRAFMTSVGRSEKSTPGLIKDAIEAGVLKRIAGATRKNSAYRIIRGKTA